MTFNLINKRNLTGTPGTKEVTKQLALAGTAFVK